MKPAKTLACAAATLLLAAGAAWATPPTGLDSPSEQPLEEQSELLLLEPVEVQDLYGVDEDGDGVADYLVLEMLEEDDSAVF